MREGWWLQRAALAPFLPALFCITACRGDGGKLQVRIIGDLFVEQGIPVTATADGWSITFDRYLVSIGDIAPSAGPGSDPVTTDARYHVADVSIPSNGAGIMVTSLAVPAGVYSDVDFRIGPPTTGAEGLNVTPQDVDFLRTQGYALLVEGTGVKGQTREHFSWGFTTPTRYVHCHGLERDVTLGPQSMEVDIHGQNIFGDEMVAMSALAFALIASADTVQSGEVTEQELAGVDIRNQTLYQSGSLKLTDLWSFIDYKASTIGGVDGSGQCLLVTRGM
jgi:hypothetical protein